MFGKLRCHGCGKRSQWPKGTREFQCQSCEATNFYDEKGEVTAPPVHITNPQPHQQPGRAGQRIQPGRSGQPAGQRGQPDQAPRFKTFTQQQPPEAPVRTDDIFCSRCLNNQRFYTEAVANYLPDEDHPDYQKYEDGLEDYKKSMEAKYPMVCKKCAVKVQEKIHRADYYGKSYQMAAMAKTGRDRRSSPVGLRDDWGKWGMRLLLGLIGLVVYGSLVVQVLWHLFGVAATLMAKTVVDEFDAPDLAAGVTYSECAAQARFLQFDVACYHVFSSLVFYAILTSVGLLWYNHGLRDWYHDTHRMEKIHGQKEHLHIQLILLFVRTFSWWKLSDPWVIADLSRYQQYAAHFITITLMLIAQRLSEKPIKAERWKYNGKMTPRPDEVDIFSATAGPAIEQYDRKASSVHPLKLFARTEKPFPIEALAPRPQSRGYGKTDQPANRLPSPPDEDDEDEDAMDIDPQPPTQLGRQVGTHRPVGSFAPPRPQLRSTYNYGTTQPLGWSGMRNEIFSIQDKTREADETKRREAEGKARLKYQPPAEQSPFRGRLPQAPMSMERKLRNPPRQVQFKAQPLSKQQDFMQQMRDSFEHGRSFGKPGKAATQKDEDDTSELEYERDEDFSPVKNRKMNHLSSSTFDSTPAKARTKGSLDLHDSGWRLSSDYTSSTGLEELMGGKGFSINDVAEAKGPAASQGKQIPLPPVWFVVMLLLGVAGGVVWGIMPVRRAICYWLIRQLGLEGVEV